MRITVAADPITVTALGRFVVTGNSQSHQITIIDAATGNTVPGGSVTVNTAGATAGKFVYAALPSPIVLPANHGYYVLSAETNGGDLWSDNNATVTTTAVAVLDDAAYEQTGSSVITGFADLNHPYVVVDFQYSSPSTPPPPPPPPGNSFVTSVSTLGNLTNSISAGGMRVTIGPQPITVYSLGRMWAPGNSGSHTLYIFDTNNPPNVIPGASVTVSMAGGTSEQFIYGILQNPIGMQANTEYIIMSIDNNWCGLLIFYFSVAVTYETRMHGALCYDLCVHVLVLLAAANIFHHLLHRLKGGVLMRAYAVGLSITASVASLAVQFLYTQRFLAGRWP
jgi:hypothetical protein